MRAVLVLALLACAVGLASTQSCRFPSFQSILGNQPGLTIVTQIVKTLEATNPAAVPAPADGVTFLAPTDAAFVVLLADSGLTTAVAQRTLAAKAASILQYHLLDGGGYTAAELLDSAALQTGLGRTLGEPLPLTFAAGTTSGSVTASGVTGEGMLSAATPVCTSSLFVVDTVLLPSRTLATVPASTPADEPASAPALAPALGPAVDAAASPRGAAIAAAAPDGATVAALAPGLAPSALLAPGAAPALAPGPGLALGPAPALAPGLAPAPATTAAVPSPSLVFGLAPSTAPTDQGAAATGASAAAVLACSAVAAVALLAAL